MPEERDNAGGETREGGSADETENERPTVSPPFDPVAFAKDVLRESPPKGVPAVAEGEAVPEESETRPRPMAPTLSDPAETEDARVRSLGSGPPAEPRIKSPPKGALSLANHRVPSNLPPPPTRRMSPEKRIESLTAMNAVDREWAELEHETRPPPAHENPEDPFAAPAPEVPGDDAEDAPTRPPPPGEMERLEALMSAGRRPSGALALDLGDDPLGLEVPIAAPPKAPEGPLTEQEMNDRVSLGDYSGALLIAEKLLLDDPSNEAAASCAESCRTVLRQMYTARVGPLDRVPTVMVPRDQLRWLSIDHKAGFVLSLVDGVSSLEMILDVSGMPELDALRILSELAQQRIISFR